MFLSENPLEDGIEYLAHSIQHSRGPSGLHMDMVEFREERNYALLLKAFTVTRHISLLSLVGTAPTPSPNIPCSETTLQVLRDFFAENSSISFLDLSGYSGKLDEGQLAKGLGRSCQGLAQNQTLTHLWIRNQNLHDDAGVLGSVLRQNRTLVMFDCQDNGLNLTSLQFLIQSLKHNHTLLDFPVSTAERDRIWSRVVGELQHPQHQQQQQQQQLLQSLQKQKKKKTLTLSKSTKNRLAEQEAGIKQVLDQSLAELEEYLDRNRQASEHQPPQQSTTDWDHHDRAGSEADFDPDKAGDWERELEGRIWGGRGAEANPDESKRVSAAARTRRRPTVRSSAMLINITDPTPYQVQPGEGMESPTDTTDTMGATPVQATRPPELIAPCIPGGEDDDIFQKVMQNLKERGFECV